MTVAEILDLLSKGGLLAGAVLLIVALIKEWVVPKGRLDEIRADKQEAIDLARGAVASTDRLSDAVEKVLSRLDILDQERRR